MSRLNTLISNFYCRNWKDRGFVKLSDSSNIYYCSNLLFLALHEKPKMENWNIIFEYRIIFMKNYFFKRGTTLGNIFKWILKRLECFMSIIICPLLTLEWFIIIKYKWNGALIILELQGMILSFFKNNNGMMVKWPLIKNGFWNLLSALIGFLKWVLFLILLS